ncbi:MAG: hypothetical protein RR491_05675 [Lachnospiraceae bacterium]
MIRKKIAIVIILMNLMALAGCTDAQKAADTQKAADAKTTADVPAPKEENEEGEKITPLPATLRGDTLNNCTVAVSFSAADIYENQQKESFVPMTLYDYELFDLVDIGKLKIGDILVINKKEMKVNSLKREQGELIINGGLEEGGCYLQTSENGVYYEVGMDGAKSYYAIEEVTLPLSKNFVYTDSSDFGQPEKTLHRKEFLTEMKDSENCFTQFATTAVIEDGAILYITQIFVP